MSMRPGDRAEFENWKAVRNKALRDLDVDWAIRQGCPPDAALAAIHKARYECLDVLPELRRASRQWLEDNGMTRMHGFPWPADDELPTGVDEQSGERSS
jgi:hypothetical protein